MSKDFKKLAVAWVSVLALSASATTITLDTPIGATAGGLPVDAEAIFTTGSGTLSITLKNLQANPGGIIQCISGLTFTLSSGLTGGSLTSSSGKERTIAADGSFTDGPVVGTGWLFSGTSLYLNDLAGGAAGPAHTLIGGPDSGSPPKYSAANNSIAGNGPHNPFLVGDVTFDLSIPGLSAADTVKGATFQFGTSTGTNVAAPDGGTTVLLLGVALSALGLLRNKWN